jgi:hypothetical protein
MSASLPIVGLRSIALRTTQSAAILKRDLIHDTG